MIRKKVLCVSTIFTILILSKLYSNPSMDSFDNPYKKMMIEHAEKIKREKIFGFSSSEKNESYVSFAEEIVPVDRNSVKQKLGKYLTIFSFKKQQSYQMHEKADKYLPRIAEVLKSYDIPEDFKYIPLVESGLNPKVTSHKGAGGYWQFMPATARLYGLRVDSKVDERLDFEKSTHAAAKYLKSLYNEFGDWTLVAAAYNVGGGSLKSSIRRQGVNDYYRLRLNAETGSYVYKLVSVKQVIENPNDYGYNI